MDSDDETANNGSSFSKLLADCRGRPTEPEDSDEDDDECWQDIGKRLAGVFAATEDDSDDDCVSCCSFCTAFDEPCPEESEDCDEDERWQDWQDVGNRLAGVFADAEDDSEDDWVPDSFCTLFDTSARRASDQSCSKQNTVPHVVAVSVVDTEFKSVDTGPTKARPATADDDLISTAPPSPTLTMVSLPSPCWTSDESEDECAEEPEDSDNDESWREVGRRLAFSKKFIECAEDDSEDSDNDESWREVGRRLAFSKKLIEYAEEDSEDSDNNESWREVGRRLAFSKKLVEYAEDDSDDDGCPVAQSARWSA
jgi:hypothetical protein